MFRQGMQQAVAWLEEENGKLKGESAARAREWEWEERALGERASEAAEALSRALQRHLKLKEYTAELGSQVISKIDPWTRRMD